MQATFFVVEFCYNHSRVLCMKLQNINSINQTSFAQAKDSSRKSLVKEYALNTSLGLTDKITDLYSGRKRKSYEAITRFKKGEISEKELHSELKRRYNARKESGELLGDLVVSAACFNVFKNISKLSSVTELFKNGLGKKTTGIALAASVLTGTVLNPVVSAVDKLFAGKNEKKKKRPLLDRFALGALNGLASPLLATSHLALTIPALLGINTGARYLADRKSDKSIQDYFQIQKDNLDLHLAGSAIGLGLLASKGKGVIKSWDEACKKAKANHQELKAFESPYGRTFNLEEFIVRQNKQLQEELGTILSNIYWAPHENKIIDSNILLAKFLQTIPDKNIDSIKTIKDVPISDELKQAIKNLKGACRPSYTPQEAQAVINKAYGDRYTIVREKPLGVGTVAETYLAKDNTSGEEVVIKFLKKGMNKEKIEADRKQALDLLAKSDLRDNKEEFSYYTKFLNTMFDAWVKETDLSLEKEAAEIMASNAKKFNVVKPIAVKDNVYVMEKAKGVQLNKLDEELKRRNMTLTQEQIKKLIMNYNEVFIEQLISIPRSGQKMVQADPNSANIFIDLDNLDKPITFLDLGNVLRYDNLTATRNALGHLDFIFGNSRGLAKTNLEGAILPDGLGYNQAVEKLTAELDKHIFNNKTQVPTPNAINDFCAQVMREMKIIPNANNANLIKAETTYFANIFELRNKIQSGLAQEIEKQNALGDQLKRMMKEMKETGDFQALVRCILTEIYTSVKNASFKTQKHAYKEIQERIHYIETHKEQALTTFYGLLN